jgi:hypothetical protein
MSQIFPKICDMSFLCCDTLALALFLQVLEVFTDRYTSTLIAYYGEPSDAIIR